MRRRPVGRLRILAGLVVATALLAAVVALTEGLRHPVPHGGPVVPELDAPQADPRFPVTCAEPAPREGEERGPAAAPAAAQLVTSSELYDCPQVWDGRMVRYRGEVVGAVLQRPGGAWVQLNDDVYAEALGPLPAHRDFRGGNSGIGVWLPPDVVARIRTVGDPKHQGDVLEVVGHFRRVDATGEVAIIRAVAGDVAIEGGVVEIPLLPDRFVALGILGPLAVALVVAERLRRQRV
jgi:hypothetical protein